MWIQYELHSSTKLIPESLLYNVVNTTNPFLQTTTTSAVPLLELNYNVIHNYSYTEKNCHSYQKMLKTFDLYKPNTA